MEELLQSVTSVRKGFEARKQSRLCIETGNINELLMQVSPNQSRTSPKHVLFKPINSVNKLNIDEFARYMKSPLKSQCTNVKISPNRKRTYKLDAATLLASRIKQFLSKQLRKWKENTEKHEEALVFKMNLGNLTEKKRYISRERYEDEEITRKASTSRHSPRSPMLFDFTLEKNRGFHKKNGKKPPIPEDKVKRSIPGTIEKLFPSSTRAASSFSQRSFDKPPLRNIKISAIDKIFRAISKIHQKTLKKAYLALYELDEKIAKKKKKSLENCIKKLEKNKNVALGAEIIGKLVIRAIAGFFHFMKFRCVIESGIFDGDSSKEEVKECIENIEQPLEIRRNSVFVELLLKVLVKAMLKPKRSCGSTEKYWKSALKLVFNNICKEMNFRCSKAMGQWRTIAFTSINYDQNKLKPIAFISNFKHLIDVRRKAVFHVLRQKNFKRPKQNTTKNLQNGVKTLTRFMKSWKKSVFFYLKLQIPTQLPVKPCKIQILKHFTKVLECRLLKSFKTLQNNSHLMQICKKLALKQLCLRFRDHLTVKFALWKRSTSIII